ncbi:MAG TPA: hypothetical protein VJH23_03485 [archaeon]|nr:hypothetical protein [archaeon]
MDEKRRAALLGATKKLLAAKASDADIIASLSELGVTEDDASLLIREIKEGQAPTLPKISPREIALGPDKSAWKESIDKRIEEEKLKHVSSKSQEAPQEKMPEDEFPKHFISKGNGEEFIPQLRRGGKEGIKEIIVESKIGSTKQETQNPRLAKLSQGKNEGDVSGMQIPEGERIIIEKIAHLEEKIDELEKEVIEEKKKKAPSAPDKAKAKKKLSGH